MLKTSWQIFLLAYINKKYETIDTWAKGRKLIGAKIQKTKSQKWLGKSQGSITLKKPYIYIRDYHD